MVKEIKKPLVAAILNFVIPGLGYLYVGKRKNFGVLLIIATILSIILTATIEWSLQDTLSLPGTIVAMFAFAYDGYKTAEEVNQGK